MDILIGLYIKKNPNPYSILREQVYNRHRLYYR